MNNFILKIILWVMISVVVGAALYTGYLFLGGNLGFNNKYNSVDETVSLANENFDSKTIEAKITSDNIDVTLRKDTNDNIFAEGMIFDNELQFYIFEQEIYTCYLNNCVSGNVEIGDDVNNALETINKIPEMLEIAKPLFNTEDNGDKKVEHEDYGQIVISDDGSKITIKSKNNIQIVITFSDKEVEKPESLFEF